MKYYITLGETQYLVKDNNPYKACMQVLRLKFNKYTDVLANRFRVSQRGFDWHPDDEYIDTSTIISLLLLSNVYEEEEIT